MNNNQKFETALIEILIHLFAFDPKFALARDRTTPERLARRMTKGLPAQEVSKDGPAVRSVCRQLKIKHTYKAIAEYLEE